jgi:hypothetical protein
LRLFRRSRCCRSFLVDSLYAGRHRVAFDAFDPFDFFDFFDIFDAFDAFNAFDDYDAFVVFDAFGAGRHRRILPLPGAAVERDRHWPWCSAPHDHKSGLDADFRKVCAGFAAKCSRDLLYRRLLVSIRLMSAHVSTSLSVDQLGLMR